jgi:hypothetical protein
VNATGAFDSDVTGSSNEGADSETESDLAQTVHARFVEKQRVKRQRQTDLEKKSAEEQSAYDPQACSKCTSISPFICMLIIHLSSIYYSMCYLSAKWNKCAI